MAKKRKSRQRGKSADRKQAAKPNGKGEANDANGDENGTNHFLEWAKSLAIAFVLFIVIRTFLLQTFVITSGSMEGTLLVGDMLVANRAAIGARIPGTRARVPGYSSPQRGEVWVFDPHHEVDMKLVKRLIGLPGDTLSMRAGVLYLNGAEYPEPYLNPDTGPDERHPDFAWQRNHLTGDVDPATYTPSRHHWGPLVIPEGHYFMLGDNRDASLDSRYWGLLEAWRLEGRAVFTYFSYNADSFRPFPALREIRWERLGRGIR